MCRVKLRLISAAVAQLIVNSETRVRRDKNFIRKGSRFVEDQLCEHVSNLPLEVLVARDDKVRD